MCCTVGIYRTPNYGYVLYSVLYCIADLLGWDVDHRGSQVHLGVVLYAGQDEEYSCIFILFKRPFHMNFDEQH